MDNTYHAGYVQRIESVREKIGAIKPRYDDKENLNG